MKILKTLSLASVSTLAIAAFSMSQADAAGFYLQEQSVSGQGTAYAGQVATPRDASIVYFNPAGMTHLKGTQGNLGVHILAPDAELTDTGSTFGGPAVGGNDGGNPYSITPLPNIHLSHEVVPDKVWLGFSVSAPFGLGNEYNDNFFGRYDSTETELKTYDIQPSIALKLNDKVSLGGGLNIQYADADLRSVANPGGGEINTQLEGDDLSYGFNVGILYQPLEGTTLGAHYRSQINHTLSGNLNIGSNPSVGARADLNLPEIVQLGINQRVTDKFSVQAGATWFGWDSFQDITVVSKASGAQLSQTVQDYQSTWALAVGGEYDLNDKWTLRAGYQFDATPTTDEFRTTLTPDGDRHWFAAGATYNLNEKISLDVAATYVDIGDESINVSRNGGAAVVSADSNGSVGILSLGVNYTF